MNSRDTDQDIINRFLPTPKHVPTQVNIDFEAFRLRTDEAGKQLLASPNNKQANRTNEARVGGRIPDIYGSVLSVPDLLTKPYSVYGTTHARSVVYYCVGRGDITVQDLKNKGGELTLTPGAGFDVYGPNQSPLNAGLGSVGLPFFCPVQSTAGVSSEIDDPILVKAPDDTYFTTGYSSSIGPFIFENIDGVVVNVIGDGFFVSFPNPGFLSRDVTIYITLQQVDANGTPFGSTHQVTHVRNALAYLTYETVTVDAPWDGRIQCTISRTQNSGTAPETTAVHKRIWVSGIYGKLHLEDNNFGNITTIRVVSNNGEELDLGLPSNFEIPGISADPSLQITCNATRQNSGSASQFGDILTDVMLDSKIGKRTVAGFDGVGLLALQTTIGTYFGTSLATEFNYTFDDSDTSFEEMVNTICRAAFCVAYRDGPVIKFRFEGVTTLNKALYNHRNKIPNSEARTVTFGYLNERDGVKFEYTDIADGAKFDFILPSDESAINIESDGPVGITNKLQAYFHAHRQFNRQKYQNTAIEFEATKEAALLIVKDRILVANNTRIETYDGEIVAKDGLVLTLSQPFTNLGAATIFVQTVYSGVVTRGITKVADNDYLVTLDADIIVTLSLEPEAYTRSLYEIVIDSSDRKDAFLVTSTQLNSNMTVGVSAVNYDARYYDNDTDYIDLVVDINGELL